VSQKFRVPSLAGGRQRNATRKFCPPSASYDGQDYNTNCSSPGLLKRRGGFQDVITSASKPAAWNTDATFCGAGVYRPTGGTPYLLVCYKRHGAATSGIAKLTITSPTSMAYSLELSGSSGINPSKSPVWFKQINDWIYFSLPGNNSTSNTYRWNGTTLQYAGLPMDAPAAYTVTYAAAGGRMETTLVGGTLHEYEYATTVVYGGLGESAITPLTNSLASTAAASTGQITLGAMAGKLDLGPTATSVQYTDATALRVYRTLNNPGQPNVTRRWFMVTEIPVASLAAGSGTTTYVDKYNDTELGDEYQGDPLFVSNPDCGAKLMAAAYLEWQHNRMWYASIYDRAATTHTPYPNRVVWSDLYMPDRVVGFVDVEPRPGDEIRGIISYKENLIVFKNTTVCLITGDTPPSGANLGNLQIIETGRGRGCVAEKTIAVGNDGVYYLSNDGVYVTDGYNFRRVSDAIRTDILGPSRAERLTASGGYFNGRYFLSYPDRSNAIFVYDENYAQPGTWHKWAASGCFPFAFFALDEQVDNATFYAGGNGAYAGSRMHVVDNSFYDVATNGATEGQIVYKWTSKWFDMDLPEMDKQFRSITIDYDKMGTSTTVQWIIDDGMVTDTIDFAMPTDRLTGLGTVPSPYSVTNRRPITMSLPDTARGKAIKLVITENTALLSEGHELNGVIIEWEPVTQLIPDGNY